MRIAFIAPYQGPVMATKRPCLRNFSLGTRTKIELVAELLQNSSHEVEILSQGEVIERELKFYPGFSEPGPAAGSVPVHYSSAFPVRFLNGFWSGQSLVRLLRRRHHVSPFDLVLICNLKPPQVACANFARRRLGLPVAMEYEDDQFIEIDEGADRVSKFTSRFHLSAARRLLGSLSGCLANSPYLLAQVPGNVPKLLLCGVVSEAVIRSAKSPAERRNWVVYSGTHSWAQGLEPLITAWKTAKLPDWELHIAGHGHLTAKLHEMAAGDPGIVFHGLLSREENAALLGSAKIAAVPYDVSQTQGFSFKTIECLAAGLHVITTPLTALEALGPDIQRGLTYIPDNAPATIAACLHRLIAARGYEITSQQATLEKYGPLAVSRLLDSFFRQISLAGGARQGQMSEPVHEPEANPETLKL